MLHNKETSTEYTMKRGGLILLARTICNLFTDSLRPCVGMAELTESEPYLRYQNPSSASCSATAQ